MKRSILLSALTFSMMMSMAASAQACFYIPWLDPFAWMGMRGCGYTAPGCCHQPVYRPPVYRAYAPPVMPYPVAPGCNCNGAAAPAPALSAVRVPVTTYRAVTQYVPQTSYQTQYRYQQPASVAYGNAVPSYIPRTAGIYPGYSAAPVVHASPGTLSPPITYGGVYPGYPTPQAYPTAPTLVQPPVIQQAPNVATPVPGDIYGDHEYPTQSARSAAPSVLPATPPVVPATTPQPYATTPIHRVSYGVPPRSARSYPSAVR